MLSKTMEAAINEQIKHEFYSAYFYLGMAAYCESNNLFGSKKWLKMQAEEEQGHAMKFFGYVLDRGGKVTLQAIRSRRPSTLRWWMCSSRCWRTSRRSRR